MASRLAYHPEAFVLPKKRAEKKKAYLAFLHHLPCAVTGQYGVEASHLSMANPLWGHYGRGRGTKAPDVFALPLSKAHHDRSHKIGERKYWEEVGIDPHPLALCLWALYSIYDEDQAIRFCTARIRQGIELARVANDRY